MTKQVDWVDAPPPFQKKSDTSRAAAQQITQNIGALRAKVFALLVSERAGLTDEEIASRLQMNPSTARPRRIELVNMGYVMDTTIRRKTQSGRSATVWATVRNQS